MPAKVAALVPCYNPGELCRPVLTALPRYVDHVLAVDDGCSDNTPEILTELAVPTLTHEVNRGKGAALLNGFRRLLENPEVGWILTIDSDGQHRPEDVPRLVEASQDEAVGLVVGSRMADPKDMPPHRRLANWSSSGLISWVAGQTIPDSQSGYRLHRRELLEQILPHISGDHFELETEILIRASHNGWKIAAVQIPSIYTEDSSRRSSYHPIRDSIRIGRIIWRFAGRRGR